MVELTEMERQMRESSDSRRIATHWQSCWREHKDCADMLAERVRWVTEQAEDVIRRNGVNTLDDIAGELEALRWYVSE